ncbi:hypothetical protein RUND412_007747 [Rhizina undulata]
MDRLPSEILQEIVSYLFASDLDSMRLVSRRFSAIANIFKFRSLRVRVSRKELDNLLNISQQPHLAKCVREITYPFDRLASVELDQSSDGILEKFWIVKVLAKQFFHWCMEKYVAQIELEVSEECLRALETAFSRMPNIKVIVPSYNTFVMRSKFKSWLNTLNNEERGVTSWESDDFWWEVLLPIANKYQALDAFEDPMETAHSVELKLDSFECGIASCWLGVGVFGNKSEFWDWASLFQNLICLSLCITTMDWFEDLQEMDKGSKEGLHKFLSISQTLRKLSLTIECAKRQKFLELAAAGPYFGDFAFPLLDILGRDHVRKCLHTFSLKFPSIRFEEIVEFLGRHASTLKCLHLQSPTLLNGTWRGLLDFLREQLHLTDFKIVSPGEILPGEEPKLMIYKVYAQRRMKNYVLHEGAPFPFTKQELEKNGKDMSKYLKDFAMVQTEEEEVYREKKEIIRYREDSDSDVPT